ncbi:38108_t:CDS:2, partial [Gigaspora margarita]
WFFNLPSCTKFLVSNVVLITLTLTMYPHGAIIYELQKFQACSPHFWGYYSSLFLLPLSITGALQLYLLYYLSIELETAKFSGITADYVYYLLFIILTITVSFDTAEIAVYLPFILLLIDTCFIQYIPHDLLAGIIAGHLYYYLKERYPVDGDIGLLNTPRWLYRIFPQISYRPSNPHKPAIHVRLGFLDWGLFGLMNIFNLLDLRNIPRHNIYDLWNTFNLYHLLNILGGRYRDLRNFRYRNERRGRF